MEQIFVSKGTVGVARYLAALKYAKQPSYALFNDFINSFGNLGVHKGQA